MFPSLQERDTEAQVNGPRPHCPTEAKLRTEAQEVHQASFQFISMSQVFSPNDALHVKLFPLA